MVEQYEESDYIETEGWGDQEDWDNAVGSTMTSNLLRDASCLSLAKNEGIISTHVGALPYTLIEGT